MKKYTISVTFRSSDVTTKYKIKNDREIWEVFFQSLSEKMGAKDIRHSSDGIHIHTFELSADVSPEECTKAVNELIAGILPEEDARNTVQISVQEKKSQDLEDSLASLLSKGKDQQPPQIKQGDAPITDSAGTAQTPEQQSASAATAAALAALLGKSEPSDPEAPEAPAAPTVKAKTDKEAESLTDKAAKLKAMKEGLLKSVKGQRHAVDEVVQTIFECDMFASQDPKRVTPLATFLFTGPSGVGKTFLAKQCEQYLGRKAKVVDMSEYSDNLANMKFNGEHGQPNVVTGFVRQHPNGILIFDEIEKAHLNTIHLFLQILDAGTLKDMKSNTDVSFRDTIIIMTTNAGKELYDDPNVYDLSGVSRSVILDALRKDINPQTREPYFPECITTRMANGHILLFNHLEPFALMEIIKNEIEKQISFFESSSGLKVECDSDMLAALVLYNGGGTADARSLRGLARNILVRELQEVVMQLYHKDSSKVEQMKNVTIRIEVKGDEIQTLFVNREQMRVAVLSDRFAQVFERVGAAQNTVFDLFTDGEQFKRRAYSVTDYVLIDPLCGREDQAVIPNDVEDFDSVGMQMFDYIREFSPETPVYILDSSGGAIRSFDTLMARGARGVLKIDDQGAEFETSLKELTFGALINNKTLWFGRAGKFLYFNCAQYIEDPANVTISFERLQVKKATRAEDRGLIAKKGQNNDLGFDDVIGCKTAKETLREFAAMLNNPREMAAKGKTMPKGVLLYGPPGTGKTLLAKAMANECEATFFPVSATSFFGSLVGETERNIRELFRKARRYAPSIIFIDEVDAIARTRTGSIGSTHNEDALTTFLAEMDGFVSDPKRPVFILAATNYELAGDGPRVLDAAFVRRFDRKLYVSLPDTDDRYELLLLSLKKHGIHFGENHEKIVRNMAVRTGGMSNADLEMMNAQYARSLGGAEPNQTNYMESVDEFRYGEIKKMDPAHVRQTACHEAGHALVCRLCGTTPSFLTIVSRGDFGGFMESATEKERGTQTFDELMNIVCRCLAGRIAEIEVYGESAGINTGASSDIAKARYIIRAALEDFAMGEHLFTRWKASEAEELMQKQYDRTREMIVSHRTALEHLTDLLAQSKSLDRTQLEEFFANENV